MASFSSALIILVLLPSLASAEPWGLQKLHASPEFSGFTALLEHASLIPHLTSVLKQGHKLTVFAPTDEALLAHTSPTVLALLKQADNKHAIRELLLSHFVAEKLSPFEWHGNHKTLSGSNIFLGLDSRAFYAGGMAVSRYNCIVGNNVTVHSIPSLIFPKDQGRSRILLQEGIEDRNSVLVAAAPAPAPQVEDFPSGGIISNAGEFMISRLLGSLVLAIVCVVCVIIL